MFRGWSVCMTKWVRETDVIDWRKADIIPVTNETSSMMMSYAFFAKYESAEETSNHLFGSAVLVVLAIASKVCSDRQILS